MTKGEIGKSLRKRVIEWVIDKIWVLIGSITIPSTIFLSIKNILIEHPYALLLLSIIMTIITCLSLWLLVPIYWRYGRCEQAFGVLWDKNYDARCLNCKKLLKYSSTNPCVLYCSDPKCNNKHVLRDDNGNQLTKQQAINYLKKRKRRKQAKNNK